MRLADYLDPCAVSLNLAAQTKDAALDELVGLLKLDERSAYQLGRLLRRRELLGSTGVGRSLAIPHCRSLALARLRPAFGGPRAGAGADPGDRKPVTGCAPSA